MTITYPHSALKSLIFSIVLALSSLSSYSQEIPTDEASIAAGKKLFDTNCKTCHRVDSRLIGPPLAGVYERAPSIEWIQNFVRNSSAVIASGDPYAVNLFIVGTGRLRVGAAPVVEAAAHADPAALTDPLPHALPGAMNSKLSTVGCMVTLKL